MKFDSNLGKKLLNFWPLIIILSVWFIFSSPYLIWHRVPFSSTYLVNFFSPWNAYPGFASPVKNNAMPDIITQIYPWKNLTIESLQKLQIPLWNPYSFSGMPLLANYQSAALSPLNLLFFILPFIDAWSILILLQPLLAGIFMYLYLRSVKLGKESSVVGSLAFMFCGFITTWMAYGTLGYAILFIPLALFALEKYSEGGKGRYLILFSLTFPLSFFSGHFQISIYFLIFVISYLIFKFLQTGNKKMLFWTLVYFLFGLLLSLPQLLPSIELYLQSLRSGIFQKLEVIPWGYLSTFVAPDFLGNPVTRNDWFGHYAEWNAYIGLLPLMLGAYALFRARLKLTLYFLIMAVLAILLSFQTPFLDLLVLLKIPVLSTSAASRIIVIFSFSMSVLAAMGLDRLIADLKNNGKKQVIIWLGLFGAVIVLLWSAVLLKMFMPLDKISIAKQNLILPTALYAFSALFIISALFLRSKRFSFVTKLIPFVLIAIVAFDMLRFSSKWMPFDPVNLMYPQVPVVSQFQKIPSYERILSNFGTEATLYYNLSSIEGYDAVYIKRYGEFIASLSNGGLQESSRSVVSFSKNGKYSKQAIDLLGVKYIIHKLSDDHSVWTFPFWTYKTGEMTLLYSDGVYQIYQNNAAFPRAFLVNKYTVENSPQKILDTMFGPGFNLNKQVVLEEDPNLTLGSGPGSVSITDYSPDKVTMSVNAGGDSLLFLSDSYYPGWQALVDGNNSKIYRADYTFRAVFVPKGSHTVEFIYSPASFNIGLTVAIMSVLLMIVFMGLGSGKLFGFPKL